jgi:hypothetical protein
MNPDQQAVFAEIVSKQYNKNHFIFGRITTAKAQRILFPGSLKPGKYIRSRSWYNRMSKIEDEVANLKPSKDMITIYEIVTIAKAVCTVMGEVCPYINQQP